jgi:probable F420-dependent oxidoreductase
MLIDATLAAALDTIGDHAHRAEEAGYDGIWVAEVDTDPFLPLVEAARRTQRVTVGTSIAVALARNPMTLANTANDLHRFSGGRFILGLGSQIAPHIEKRFSMPWSHPAPRMREFIRALHAIWSCWNDGAPLQFRGEFYRHTLMTPFFAPPPNPHGRPAVYLAAVGPAMTRVAAEVADGLFVHPFTTRRYLDEVTIPTLEAALQDAGRDRKDFVTCLPPFVVTGRDEAEMAHVLQQARMQLAFYGSTPAYARVLALHGWEQLHATLNRLSKQGEWEQMAAAIDDEVVDAFAIVAEPDDVPAAVRERYGGIIDRLGFPAPGAAHHDLAAALVPRLRTV